MKVLENHSLKLHNTFGVDVKARYFIELESLSDYDTIIKDKELSGMAKYILGSGSNVLFIKDYHGVIIKNCIKGIDILEEDEDSVIIKFGGGENWDETVKHCVKNGYAGLENLSLIPGTVGAAPVQNIGAYGAEIKDVFVSLNGIFIEKGIRKSFTKDECNFGYRSSIFKNTFMNKFFVSDVTMKLSKKGEVNLSYKALKDYCDGRGVTKPTIANIRKFVVAIRQSKLPDPEVVGNAGSFFKNPFVDEDKYESLAAQYKSLIVYKSDEGYKIPAGWLIEQCGLKGYRESNVGIYPKQALVIVNYGDAGGDEIISFSKMVQTEVMNKFGILLEPEVNII